MNKIACIADIHGQLPDDFYAKDKIDILLIAGDICTGNIYKDANFLVDFNDWLNNQPIKNKIIIAGNHDFIFEKHKQLLPELNCHYLQDNSIIVENLKIYGSPWCPIFMDWAFNLSEEKLKEKWELFPKDIDILLTHCPPLGIMDNVKDDYKTNNFGYKQIGSESLRNKIFEIMPKLVVFGHNHSQWGITDLHGITFVNCSLVDEAYDMIKEPIIIELD